MVKRWLRFPSGRPILTVLIAIVAVGMFACGEEPVEPVAEQFGLEIDKQTVTIEGALEGRPVTQTFLLVNRGDQASIVSDVSLLDSSECDQVELPRSPFFVPPGDSLLMSVKMKPHSASETPHNIQIGMKTQEGGDELTKLSINIESIAPAKLSSTGPRLGIDRTSIDIGKIPYNWPMHEQFELFNYGDEPLRFDGTPLIRILEGC